MVWTQESFYQSMECDSPGECSPESDRRFDNVCGSHLKSQIERPDETHLKMTRTDYQKVGHT